MHLKPDLEQANKMLNRIAPNGDGLTFQVFDDNQTKLKNERIPPQVLNGSFEQHCDRLTMLNNQGAGVFVTIQKTDGQGRSKNNIKAIRAFTADFDNPRADRLSDMLNLENSEAILNPNLIVESSTGQHHAYWLFDGIEESIKVDDFEHIQSRLHYFLQSIWQDDKIDTSLKDKTKVLRLAGFYHQKIKKAKGDEPERTGEPFMVSILHEAPNYSNDQLEKFLDSLPALPLVEPTEQSKRCTDKHTDINSLTYTKPNNQLPQLTAEKVRALSRGRWGTILNRLGYAVGSDPKEHTPCPICGGTDRFRFDNEHGKGTFICSQGTGDNISGDGLSLLIDHADMVVTDALTAVTSVLNEMGLISPDDIQGNQSKDWEAPREILTELPPVKTITKDMLPDSLWRYVDNQAERLSVPIEYVAIPLLIALAGIIGTKVSIFPKFLDDWEIVPNLWGAIIGNPSTKKTPSISAGMKPLHNLTYKAKAEYEQAQKEFATHKEINKHKAKALDDELKALAKKQAKQADDDENKITDADMIAKAQAIAEATSADEFEPKLKRYIANDSTYQKLGEMLSQTNNGLVIERDELTGLLASLDGETNSEARNFYLEAFNGTGSHIMDRIGRGSVFIENHCLSIIGGIQPNKLERYLERTIKGLDNDGMMQRFQLAVYPDHIKGRKENDIAPDKDIRQTIYDLFETLDNLNEWELVNFGANPSDEYHKRPYYRFTKEAYNIFMPWYDELKATAEDTEHSVIAEHMTKYPNTVASLALIFHIVDCIEYQANLGSISATALKTAIKWHTMLETHMNRIYSLVTDSSNIKASYLADKITRIVKKGTDKTDKTDWIEHGFTARQLIRKGWKGLTDTDEVVNALEVLLEHDWLKWESVESTGQGGRPTERYYINPRIRELF